MTLYKGISYVFLAAILFTNIFALPIEHSGSIIEKRAYPDGKHPIYDPCPFGDQLWEYTLEESWCTDKKTIERKCVQNENKVSEHHAPDIRHYRVACTWRTYCQGSQSSDPEPRSAKCEGDIKRSLRWATRKVKGSAVFQCVNFQSTPVTRSGGLGVQADRSGVQSDGSEVQSDGSEIQSDGSEIQSDGSGVQSDGSGAQADGPRAQAHRPRAQANRRGVQADGLRVQVDTTAPNTNPLMPQEAQLFYEDTSSPIQTIDQSSMDKNSGSFMFNHDIDYSKALQFCVKVDSTSITFNLGLVNPVPADLGDLTLATEDQTVHRRFDDMAGYWKED